MTLLVVPESNQKVHHLHIQNIVFTQIHMSTQKVHILTCVSVPIFLTRLLKREYMDYIPYICY